MSFFEMAVRFILIFHLKLIGLFSPKTAERGKRMLFLSSLTIELQNKGLIRKTILSQINSEMKLCVNEDVLNIGTGLSSTIWADLDLKINNKECPTSENIIQIAKYISERAPDWLSYDENRMQYDIAKLIASYPTERCTT